MYGRQSRPYTPRPHVLRRYPVPIHRLISLDQSIPNVDRSPAILGDLGIVGHKDDRDASLLAELLKERDDALARLGIQIAGGEAQKRASARSPATITGRRIVIRRQSHGVVNMKIEILCQADDQCELMRAKVYQALIDLNLRAEVVSVMDPKKLAKLRYRNLPSLLIDGRLVAVGSGHTVHELRKLIDLGTAVYH